MEHSCLEVTYRKGRPLTSPARRPPRWSAPPRAQAYFDAWGEVYETRVYGITGGSGTGYATTREWRDKRGLVANLALTTQHRATYLRHLATLGAGPYGDTSGTLGVERESPTC